MERVQIVSGANGVFCDSAGRMLRPMGDISPSIGDWVWTNGTTIYGHRESGEIPSVISQPGNPVLPVCFSGNPAEGCSYQQLGSFKKDGSWEHFVNFSYRDKPLNGYVGDGNHAYGCVWGQKYYKWYNLLTGEYLGEFDFDDACIGEHGELLTIEHQDYSRVFAREENPSVTSVEEHYSDFEGKIDVEGFDLLCSGDTSILTYFPLVYSNAGTSFKEDAKEVEGYIRIRANGKEIRKIDLARYANQIKESVMQRIRSVENAGNASGEEVLPERTKPTGGMGSIYVNCSHLRIYKNGEFFAFAYGSGIGYAYPYVTIPGINFKKSLQLKEEGSSNYVGKVKVTKSQYSDIDWTEVHGEPLMSGVEKDDPCYRHEYTQEAEIDINIKGYRYWINVTVSDSLMVGLGKAEGEYLNAEGVSARNNGAVIGPYTTATNETDENEVNTSEDPLFKPYTIPILAGYPLQAVCRQVPAGYLNYTTYKSEGMHKYAKNKKPFMAMDPHNTAFKNYGAHHSIVMIGTSGALGLILHGSNRSESIKEQKKTVSDRDWTKEAWNTAGGSDSATMRSEMNPIPKTYDLGNGFTISLKLYQEYDVNSCRGFSLYDKGQMIFDTDSSGGLSYWCYRFEGIKIIKLSEKNGQGKYLMVNSLTSDPPFIIENGKCTAAPNIYTVYKTYTLAYFRRREKLQQGIERTKADW